MKFRRYLRPYIYVAHKQIHQCSKLFLSQRIRLRMSSGKYHSQKTKWFDSRAIVLKEIQENQILCELNLQSSTNTGTINIFSACSEQVFVKHYVFSSRWVLKDKHENRLMTAQRVYSGTLGFQISSLENEKLIYVEKASLLRIIYDVNVIRNYYEDEENVKTKVAVFELDSKKRVVCSKLTEDLSCLEMSFIFYLLLSELKKR